MPLNKKKEKFYWSIFVGKSLIVALSKDENSDRTVLNILISDH